MKKNKTDEDPINNDRNIFRQYFSDFVSTLKEEYDLLKKEQQLTNEDIKSKGCRFFLVKQKTKVYGVEVFFADGKQWFDTLKTEETDKPYPSNVFNDDVKKDIIPPKMTKEEVLLKLENDSRFKIDVRKTLEERLRYNADKVNAMSTIRDIAGHYVFKAIYFKYTYKIISVHLTRKSAEAYVSRTEERFNFSAAREDDNETDKKEDPFFIIEEAPQETWWEMNMLVYAILNGDLVLRDEPGEDRTLEELPF